MKTLYVLTGASGAGKTAAAKIVASRMSRELQVCYFDSIGVPTPDEMVRQFGSGEVWQRVKTKEWVHRIKKKYLSDKPTLLDGQVRPSNVDEACAESIVEDYKIILFDCSDAVRAERLVSRGHPELVNEKMMSWARYLREASTTRGLPIIDTTSLNIEEAAAELISLIGRYS